MNTVKFSTVDEYISTFPEEIILKLEEIRAIIKIAAPHAVEVISYNMPAYKQNGVLVYFAGYKGHIGFYPTGSGIEAFKHEFSAYKSSKGAVQFALDKPIPADLVARIVQFRIEDDNERETAKKIKKK